MFNFDIKWSEKNCFLNDQVSQKSWNNEAAMMMNVATAAATRYNKKCLRFLNVG